jgi:hypothetical protein
MEKLAMVAVAFGWLLFGACAVPVEAEMGESEEAQAENEETVARGTCEDAVDKGADEWQSMCDRVRLTLEEKALCRKEHSQGRGQGKRQCPDCIVACVKLDEYWLEYCQNRIPQGSKRTCNTARKRGAGLCQDHCLGRSVDTDEGDGSTATCSILQSERST